MKTNDVADVLQRALGAAQLRQNVIAHNIANVNTPGFKRSHVEFEEALAKALEEGRDAKSVQPAVIQETDTSLRPDGNNVDIEVENAEMAENQVYYSALARQLSDHFSRLRTAIRGGN